jgi:ABC-type anion transport system duplicated permease subunit
LYTLFGAFWIIFSDNILRLLSPNPQTYQYLQTYKGLFYVIATAVLLLGLVKREFHLRDVMQSRLEEALEIQERLRQELHHRVKNNLQLVQSMLSLQRNELEERTWVYPHRSDAQAARRRDSLRLRRKNCGGAPDSSTAAAFTAFDTLIAVKTFIADTGGVKK